jgi:DnaJ-class molecular chaperone
MCRDHQLLSLSCKASRDEIKKTYLNLAKKMHPDIDQSIGSNERFVQLKGAYDRLMSQTTASFDATNIFSNISGSTNGVRININGMSIHVDKQSNVRIIVNGVEI